MRRVLVMIWALAGTVLLWGTAQSPPVTAQTQGVIWINDTQGAKGKGIHELTIDGKLSLLIPRETLGAIASMAIDAQGQIFLLDVNGRRILKATPSGQITVVLERLSISRPQALGVDAQGNFILAELLRAKVPSGSTIVSRPEAGKGSMNSQQAAT
jgi:hypothetical protein